MATVSQNPSIQGPAGNIESVIDAPGQGPVHGTAVLAHPHPLYQGTMTNKVVHTMARACVAMGWRAVRFNFRGVGQSAGEYDEGRGELQDMLTVIEQTADADLPLIIGGFSFGSFVASHALATLHGQRPIAAAILVGTAAESFQVAPIAGDLHDKTLVVHGEHDDTISLTSVLDWARPQVLPVTVIPGGEHFFHGQLPLLKTLVERHLAALFA